MVCVYYTHSALKKKCAMRIIFVTSKLNFRTSGGSVEEIDLMLRTLQKSGHTVTAVTAFSQVNDIQGPMPYRVCEERIRSKRLIPIHRGVYRILKKYEREADVFHVDGHLMLYGAGAYRRLGGKVPVAAFFNRELGCFPPDQSDAFSKEPFFLGLKRKARGLLERSLGMWLANGMDLFTFISPMYQKAYEEFGLAKRANSFVIGDPIDFKMLMAKNGITPESYRARNKQRGPVTLFFSSRMAPGKGFDFLLTGFSKVRHKENFRLILGGSGPEEALIHRMVRDLQLHEYVEFPGWVSKEKLYGFYKTADIFIQAKWRSIGTSISLLYAMAFGVPSILPRGGGLEWQAKESALYFTDGDAHGLAEAIEMLGSDASTRARLSANCYRRLAEDEQNHEKQIGRLESAMKEL